MCSLHLARRLKTGKSIGATRLPKQVPTLSRCIPGSRLVTPSYTLRLENELDAFNEPLPPLKDFILPGGGPAAAACHLARTVCRRAERLCWSLSREETISADALIYLNRLSDLLFVIARVLARHENGSEIIWRRR